jgi:hypothetical protein
MTTPATGSIFQTDKTWICDGPVNLDSVTVTMTTAALGDRRAEDAVHLESGCTGTIARIDITTYLADGIKVAQGAHDITVEGGSVRCLAKAPVLHQDGIQVMGGARLTFKNLSVDCGRPDESLINSNLFITESGNSTTPPSDVVCDGCTLGGGAAHTVLLGASIRSGVLNSTICRAKFPSLTFTVGADAIDPVDSGNTTTDCSSSGPTTPTTPVGSKAPTIALGSAVVTYGQALVVSGAFKDKAGRRVTLYARPFGAPTFTPVTTVRTGDGGRWQVVAHPGIQTTYQASSRTGVSSSVTVHVRPRLLLTRLGSRLEARAVARRSFAGRNVYVERLVGGKWQRLLHLTLGSASSKVFALPGRGLKIRLELAQTPGYLGAVTQPLVIN